MFKLALILFHFGNTITLLNEDSSSQKTKNVRDPTFGIITLKFIFQTRRRRRRRRKNPRKPRRRRRGRREKRMRRKMMIRRRPRSIFELFKGV